MQISNEQLHALLSNIPDPKMRKELSDIATGKITHEILCLSEDVFIDTDEPVLNKKDEPILNKDGSAKTKSVKTLLREGCKGRSIAKVYSGGKIVMTSSDGKAWLKSSRDRFDGNKGFQCWCGQDSLLAKQEMGHIGESVPSNEDLGAIWQKITKDPSSYPVINGEKIVDGFMIKEII